jgi:hypothetical protein
MPTGQREPVMSTKATSILRFAALLGAAVAALTMAPAVMAIDQGFAPWPDSPGVKQAENPAGKATTGAVDFKVDFKKQCATVRY